MRSVWIRLTCWVVIDHPALLTSQIILVPDSNDAAMRNDIVTLLSEWRFAVQGRISSKFAYITARCDLL